ncbi:MAG: hypothetical protein ACLTZB_04535 [Streptococcus salivarius]
MDVLQTRRFTGYRQVRADHGYLKYFDKNGIQVKGKTIVEDGKTYYYDAHSGALVTSSFAEIAPNQWSYFNTVRPSP